MLAIVKTNFTKKAILVALTTCMFTVPIALPAIAQEAVQPVATLDPAPVKQVTNAEELERWMAFYYLHPQPELLVQALRFADQSGMVKQGEAPLTAFVSRIFSQNPKSIPGWVAQLSNLSPQSKPMLWTALWWSNTIEGKDQLNKLATSYPNQRDQDAVLSQMAKPSEPIDKIALNRPEVLDELWGAFSATGDEKYVNRLISTLPWLTDNGGDYIKLTLAGAAKWSLVSNARMHSKVMACIMKARQEQPAIRHNLDSIIAEAQKSPSGNGQQASQAGQHLQQ